MSRTLEPQNPPSEPIQAFESTFPCATDAARHNKRTYSACQRRLRGRSPSYRLSTHRKSGGVRVDGRMLFGSGSRLRAFRLRRSRVVAPTDRDVERRSPTGAASPSCGVAVHLYGRALSVRCTRVEAVDVLHGEVEGLDRASGEPTCEESRRRRMTPRNRSNTRPGWRLPSVARLRVDAALARVSPLRRDTDSLGYVVMVFLFSFD